MKFSLQHQEIRSADHALRIRTSTGLDVHQLFVDLGQIAFQVDSKHRLADTRAHRARRDFDRAIEKFVRTFEIVSCAIILGEIHQKKCILWTQGSRFLHVSGGFSPFALPTLNRSNREKNIGRIRQSFSGDGEFVQSPLVIALAIIMVKAERHVCLWQVRLQAERFFSCCLGFCSPRRRGIESVIDPVFHPGQCCKRARKIWIEPGRSLK